MCLMIEDCLFYLLNNNISKLCSVLHNNGTFMKSDSFEGYSRSEFMYFLSLNLKNIKGMPLHTAIKRFSWKSYVSYDFEKVYLIDSDIFKFESKSKFIGLVLEERNGFIYTIKIVNRYFSYDKPTKALRMFNEGPSYYKILKN